MGQGVQAEAIPDMETRATRGDGKKSMFPHECELLNVGQNGGLCHKAKTWCIVLWSFTGWSLTHYWLGAQFGKVSSPREAACCFARSRRFSMLVVLLFRLGREEEACRIGEDHTC